MEPYLGNVEHIINPIVTSNGYNLQITLQFTQIIEKFSNDKEYLHLRTFKNRIVLHMVKLIVQCDVLGNG